ncbi:MAG: tetratricopeptide repeat protein [Smithella sp.]|nr:tetratricopeptide repeat protein [Smithella sp.]
MEMNSFEKERSDFLRVIQELFQENKLDQALHLAEERLRQYPADADTRAIHCELLAGLGRINDMRKALSGLDQIIADLNQVYERAGDACRDKGFHQEAAVCYEKFLSLRPDAEKAGEIIGKMAFLEQQDDPRVDIGDVDQENVHQQNFFTVTMAQMYIEQGHLQDAETILEEIINQEPGNAQALALLDKLRSSSLPEDEKNSRADQVISILSAWLKNIERLRVHDAEK